MSEFWTYGAGVVGNCCTHGAYVARALAEHPRISLVAGYEADSKRGPELAEAMGHDLAADYDAVIDDPQVEIVGIATDPSDKAEMVERACARGKDVWINKPLCESLDSARRIVRAVAHSGVKLVHDIPMVKGLSIYAKFRQEVAAGEYGRPISYAHNFGMTFGFDFDIGATWPERFDPPAISGGGEMTNMGCYAIDYLATLFGLPEAVQAKRADFWEPYRQAHLENFGQIVCDYGDFFALLSVGKQQLGAPRQGTNVLTAVFPHHTFLFDPYNDTLRINGAPHEVAEYLGDFRPESSLNQLLRCIETGAEPEDNAQVSAQGVELLMAAYHSVSNGGQAVALPLEDGANPLVTT